MSIGVLLGSLVSIRQFANAPHLFPVTLTLSSARMTRICWYEPGASPVEPRVARKHWFEIPRRSVCIGLFFKFGVRSIQLGSLSLAFALALICTSVMVT